ncbi:MAG TPA: hypothetical protein PLJ35_05195 [Anaerolineae bacterium]|mgnify:CR=1 FL=1|nr:hypothetical protein [Anaerolineae bacterium]
MAGFVLVSNGMGGVRVVRRVNAAPGDLHIGENFWSTPKPSTRIADRYEVELTARTGAFAARRTVWVYRTDVEEQLERDGVACRGGVFVDEDGWPLSDDDYYRKAVEVAQRRW